MKIKVYDFNGKKKGIYDFKTVTDGEVNESLLAQYVRIYRANQRQGTLKVKTRSEVRGGGKKPYRQKGTGRARAGSIRSPIWVGGGTVHGPIPRNYNLKFTKKMLKSALRSALAIKIQNRSIDAFEYPSTDKYSTKNAKHFLDAVAKDKKVLILHEGKKTLYKSFRNLPNARVSAVRDCCVHDILSCEKIFIESDSVKLFERKFEK